MNMRVMNMRLRKKVRRRRLVIFGQLRLGRKLPTFAAQQAIRSGR